MLTKAERYYILNTRYLVRADAATDAKLLGTGYGVVCSKEAYGLYFKVKNLWDAEVSKEEDRELSFARWNAYAPVRMSFSPEVDKTLKAMRDSGAILFSCNTKPFRVFYNCGVYEYYANTGRAPLDEYRKRGKLLAAYNAHANIWAHLFDEQY